MFLFPAVKYISFSLYNLFLGNQIFFMKLFIFSQKGKNQ